MASADQPGADRRARIAALLVHCINEHPTLTDWLVSYLAGIDEPRVAHWTLDSPASREENIIPLVVIAQDQTRVRISLHVVDAECPIPPPSPADTENTFVASISPSRHPLMVHPSRPDWRATFESLYSFLASSDGPAQEAATELRRLLNEAVTEANTAAASNATGRHEGFWARYASLANAHAPWLRAAPQPARTPPPTCWIFDRALVAHPGLHARLIHDLGAEQAKLELLPVPLYTGDELARLRELLSPDLALAALAGGHQVSARVPRVDSALPADDQLPELRQVWQTLLRLRSIHSLAARNCRSG